MINVRFPQLRKPGIMRNEKGFTLVEILIVVAMTGIMVAGVLMVIGTSTNILVKTRNQETAKDIAATEMEYIRSLPFSGSYTLPALPAIYSNFTLNSTNTPPFTAIVTPLQLGEQKIEIDVFLKGSTTPIFTIVDYRVDY